MLQFFAQTLGNTPLEQFHKAPPRGSLGSSSGSLSPSATTRFQPGDPFVATACLHPSTTRDKVLARKLARLLATVPSFAPPGAMAAAPDATSGGPGDLGGDGGPSAAVISETQVERGDASPPRAPGAAGSLDPATALQPTNISEEPPLLLARDARLLVGIRALLRELATEDEEAAMLRAPPDLPEGAMPPDLPLSQAMRNLLYVQADAGAPGTFFSRVLQLTHFHWQTATAGGELPGGLLQSTSALLHLSPQGWALGHIVSWDQVSADLREGRIPTGRIAVATVDELRCASHMLEQSRAGQNGGGAGRPTASHGARADPRKGRSQMALVQRDRSYASVGRAAGLAFAAMPLHHG